MTNDGDSPADSTGLIDAIPFGTTYVPGSLKIGGTGVSDAAGDDEGEVVAANVIARLGSDATDSAGGRLLGGESATVTFGVTVNSSNTDGATLANTAVFSFNELTFGHTGASNRTSSSVVVPPTLTFTESMPDGAVDNEYNNLLTNSDGTGPFTWSINGGTLPPGLTLDPSTGLLSGTPTAAGTYPFDVRIVDANTVGYQIGQHADQVGGVGVVGVVGIRR